MSVLIPPVSRETQEWLTDRLLAMAPHFTPEWVSDGDSVGAALIRIFAALTQETLDRLNRTQKRNMLAFLDMMGIRLLPKTPAQAFLRFHVTDGTPEAVIVPARTLVTASSPSGEIPFETEKDLNANQGSIVGMFGVDSANDAIYQPPAGFLQKTVVGPAPPGYTTAAFSVANSQKLQLDLVDGVEPGDTLRIAGSDFVVQDIKGRIVDLVQPLTADVDANTPVSKRTTFELFHGIDLQEHSLYLSDSEYFQMKDAATVTLVVNAAQTGDPTEVVWEFFTEHEDTKVQEWVTLPISLDTTEGLSRGGTIELLKPKGEIKEVQIDGQSGRWIRARRNAKIAPLDALSKLDSIQLQVSSSGSFQADAGFYNEAPVSVTSTNFNPLGFEPQLGDRFQLASTEAFSKPDADVVLTFNLDTSRLLGPPSIVAAPATLFRVFARGVFTRLTEADFSKTSFREIKNAPSLTAPGAIPAAVTLPNSDFTGVFVRCSDGSVQLLTSATISGPDAWITLDKPGSSDVLLDPAAVAIPGRGEWVVFAVANNQIWSKATTPTGGAGRPWKSVPLSFVPSSAPAAALDGTGNPVLFVFDDQSKLRRIPFSFVVTDWQAGTITTVATAAQPKSLASAHPFALDGNAVNGEPTVLFVNATNGITAVRGATDQDLGTSPNRTPSADPCCILLFDSVGAPDHFQVFAPFDPDGQLNTLTLSLNLVPAASGWTGVSNPQAISGRPQAIGLFRRQYHVFAASNQSSMLQLAVRPETGTVTDVDSSRMLFLGQQVPLINPSGNPRFARVSSMPASAAPEPLIEPFDGPSLARFTTFHPSLAKGLSYELFELLETVTVDAGSAGVTIKLNPPTTVAAAANLWISVDNANPAFAAIANINGPGDTVTLSAAIAPSPAAGDTCRIFLWLHQNTTARETQNQVLLDNNAEPFDRAYEGAEIEISNARTLVDDYDGVNRVIKLRTTIGANLDPYSFPDQWFAIQDPALDDIAPTLSWEYWNGKGWANLQVADQTKSLVKGGTVTFTVPKDIAPTEVAGQSNYWVRARLVGGNYGQVRFDVISTTDTNGQTTYTTQRKDFSRPPIVSSLTITYDLAEAKPPELALTLNNLDYIDQTAANIAKNDKSFEPFSRLDSKEKTVYLGFDQQVSSGSILFALVQELAADDSRKLVWEAQFQNRFQEIEIEDETAKFTHLAGVVEFDIPFIAEERQLLGIPAYWMRARLVKGDWPQSPELSGVFPNVVEARQMSTYLKEILGPSDGTPNQIFEFQHKPVFEEEEIRVRTQLTDEDRKRIIAEDGADAIVDFLDEAGNVIESWVLWKEVLEFADSNFDSRHYRLDRAAGEVQFGDRVHGAVPPIGGDNIRAFQYRSGGGVAGNVDVNTIQSLVTAIAGIDVVSNPLPAAGGSEEATRDEMIVFGPQEINSRDRAVASADFEFLARQASREVVKARCIPNRDNAGNFNRGWVSVHIVAASTDPQPQPPLELCALVQSELLQRAPAALAASGHIFVGPPDYVQISVTVTVAAVSIAQVALAESSTRAILDEFLHPLTGGLDGAGWEFGQGLALSALYTVIEKLASVDHVETISVTPTLTNDYLQIGPNQILASGQHVVSAIVAKPEEAWR